jgi:hypothetical protein
MDDQLQELINLQKEQNQLLKKYLWRFRFSLMALLLVTTATAVGLGIFVYQGTQRAAPPPTAITGTLSPAPYQGSFRLGGPEVGPDQATADLYQLLDELKSGP